MSQSIIISLKSNNNNTLTFNNRLRMSKKKLHLIQT